MRNGVQRNRLQRLKRAREWRPYRVERPVREAPIGPRGRLEIVDQWTDQLVRVVDEKNVQPVDSDDT
jgi:hypothetical protein